jgi:exosortase
MAGPKSISATVADFTPVEWVKVGCGLVLIGLLVYAYGVQPVEATMSCYDWLTGHWKRISHYSHGPLIPLIAVYIVWWKRAEFKGQPVGTSRWGVPVLLFAMLLYYAGVKAVQPRAVVISLVLVLYGIALALGGRRHFQLLFFPISFLFLMIPLNFLEERVAVPLRHIQAYLSVATLNGLGIQAQKVGTSIWSEVFKFDVADPCSGIRSLMALTTVTAAFGYLTHQSQWRRWVLFLSAVPLAVLGNYVRVVGIALLAQNFGTKVAMDVHDSVAGFIVFGVALGAMVGIGWLLKQDYRRLWQHWTKPNAPQGSPA